MSRTETGYGFFIGGDPRRFFPDEESCTPGEIAAHKAACALWDAGDTTPLPGSCTHFPGGVITTSSFGIGGYTYDVDDGPWYPRALRHPWVTRTPRRLKKTLKRRGWRMTEVGWSNHMGDPCAF